MNESEWSDEENKLLHKVQNIHDRNFKIKQSLDELTSMVNQNQTKLVDLMESIKNIELNKDDLPNEKIVNFNIGGTIFSCFLSTITKKIKNPQSNEFYEPNLLELIVNGDVSTKRDQEKRFFIERSPKYFDYVLSYLRLANTDEHMNLIKTKVFLKDLLEEARYYNVVGLKLMIKEINNKIVLQNSLKAAQSKDNSKFLNSMTSNESKSKMNSKNHEIGNSLAKKAEKREQIEEENNDISPPSQFDLNHNKINCSGEDSFWTIQNKSASNLKKSPNTSLNQSMLFPNNEIKQKTSVKNDSLSQNKNQEPDVKCNNLDEEYIHFTDCLISYIHASDCFFVQKDDFDEELNKIQKEIDECLEPYDSRVSSLCIGQFKDDGSYYRCRISHWFQNTNEAECMFIDFGNIEFISIDTITKMSEPLKKAKPLALCCKLSDDIKTDSEEFQELRNIVANGTRFDVRVKKGDLERFNSSVENYDCEPVPAELCSSKEKIMLNKENLARKIL
jgi:hypothetical protein